MLISGWGNYPKIEADVISPDNDAQTKDELLSSGTLIPRGLGRSYGDSALSERVMQSDRLGRFMKFDPDNGMLECECGVSLRDILDIFVPRGWFLPVVPGTSYVSVGGAIAADVHGKNHHKAGSFCNHVLSLRLMLPDGDIVLCSEAENQTLFRATCGGMGLTGFILSAQVRLVKIKTAYIKQTAHKAANLHEITELFDAHKQSTYSVAWIDCLTKGKALGRSILYVGEHMDYTTHTNPLFANRKNNVTVPFYFPDFALTPITTKVFNSSIYHKQIRKSQTSEIDYNTFFFPLDSVLQWNKIYGRRGFAQYQFVLPKEAGAEGVKDIIRTISNRGEGSFLAVLKLFGRGNSNLLSFPEEGYTLALDFPISVGLLDFLNTLDDMLAAYKGRLYLAKDSRMSAEMFKKTYPNALAFADIKRSIDKKGKLQSLQSRRLAI